MDRKLLSLLMLALAALPGTALARDADSPLGDALPSAIQDPVMPAHHYAPSVPTDEAADVGPALNSVALARRVACTHTNPCALATPARGGAGPAAPSKY